MFFYREGLPLYIWFYPPLFNYDVSLHDLVKLVVVIPTSPRTSKAEFVCEFYARFGVNVPAVFCPAVVPGRYRPVPEKTGAKPPRNLPER